MAVGQQRLEKTGGFKISTVRTLHSIDALLEQLQSSVRVHLPNQAARSIQSYWRRHMQYMDVKKRQEQREEAGKASKAQLREEMQRLAEERQKEQIKIPKSGTRSSAGAPPVVAPARFGSGAQSTPIGAPPVKSQSQVGASTSSAMEAAPGEPEKLAKVKEDFEDLEAAPGLESQDGKIGDLLSAKDVGECDGDLGEKDEDSAGKMEHQTLTEGRLEGKEILEQILPEPVVSRCFADVETFDLPTQAPVTSEMASECSASQKSLEKEREEQRETLRCRMRALAEERQAEEAKAVRRKAMKQLRQRVGPRPADATLHGLLSRCDGNVNRAATAFWNGLPFAWRGQLRDWVIQQNLAQKAIGDVYTFDWTTTCMDLIKGLVTCPVAKCLEARDLCSQRRKKRSTPERMILHKVTRATPFFGLKKTSTYHHNIIIQLLLYYYFFWIQDWPRLPYSKGNSC